MVAMPEFQEGQRVRVRDEGGAPATQPDLGFLGKEGTVHMAQGTRKAVPLRSTSWSSIGRRGRRCMPLAQIGSSRGDRARLMSDPHEMDKYLQNVRWNDLNPDDQVMTGLTLLGVIEAHPDMLTREERDDVARFVGIAQRLMAAQKQNGLPPQ